MRKVKKTSSFRSKVKKVLLLVCCAAVLAGLFVALSVLNQETHYPSLQPQVADNTSSSKEPKTEFTVSIVCGGHVQCQKGIVPLKKALKYLESRFNVSFKIQNVFPAPVQPDGTIEERWMEWFNIAAGLGAIKNDLTVILVETYPDNVDTFDFRMEGVIGLASGIGVLGGPQPAGLIAKVMGSEQFMTRLLIHEIGHTLGAEHIEEGIMHPCACANQYSDEFSIFNVQQIKEHLARVKLYRTLTGGRRAEKKEEPNSTPMKTDSVIIEDMNGMCA